MKIISALNLKNWLAWTGVAIGIGIRFSDGTTHEFLTELFAFLALPGYLLVFLMFYLLVALFLKLFAKPRYANLAGGDVVNASTFCIYLIDRFCSVTAGVLVVAAYDALLSPWNTGAMAMACMLLLLLSLFWLLRCLFEQTKTIIQLA